MPIQIGRPPDHNFTRTFGLAQRLPPPHRVFPRRSHHGDGRTPVGLLTPAQCAEIEAALGYFATASPKHTADEEDSLFPRLRDTHDPAAKRALTLVERLERDHDIAERHHHAVEALCGDGSQMEASKGQRPRSCEDTLRLCERSISDTSMLRIASCSPRPLGYFPLRRSRTSAVKWRNVDPVASD